MKRLALFFIYALTLLLMERTVRAFFATRVGNRIFLYGTPWFRQLRIPAPEQSVQIHRNKVGDYQPYAPYRAGTYSKYFPYETKVSDSPDHHEVYPVRINNHGFRGKDFAIEKSPGTLRVLTLGSSSTFGYHDRDDETYPYYLEQLLNESPWDGMRFEVINFGIPHATSDNIVAMFLAEGVQLDPDVVTLYEGANDSAVLERGEPSVAGGSGSFSGRGSSSPSFSTMFSGSASRPADTSGARSSPTGGARRSSATSRCSARNARNVPSASSS